MKRKILSFLSFLALCALMDVGVVHAQSTLESDAVAYRFDSSKALVELYYGILQRSLAFTQNGNSWDAPVAARAEIWQNAKVISSQDINKPVHFVGTRAALDSLSANKLLGAAAFEVPYSENTQAAFIWNEKNSQGKAVFDTIVTVLSLPDKDTTHFAVGGIEFGSALAKSDGTQNPFEKIGYVLTPNPSAVYGENYTKLYYYTEIYVPRAAVDPSQNLQIVTRILDGSGHEIVANTQKQPIVSTTIPIIASLDIDGLPGDTYRLQITVKHEDVEAAQKEKPFYYVSDMKLSEDAPPAAGNSGASDELIFASSELSKLTDQEADDRIAQTLYVAAEADRKAAKSLKTLDEKEHWLFSYWRKQDALHPNVQPLSAYRAFAERVDEANKKFSYQKTIGWKSARGRVFIMYGEPAVVTTELFDPEYKPYIVWQYDPDASMRLTSGSRPEFDFVDRQGGGNFFLVNSNVQGETSEPGWMTREAYRLAH